MDLSLAWLAVAPAVPLAFTLVNLLTWRPPGPASNAARSARVLAMVPARDEAEQIEACLRALLATTADEVHVYDDASTDGTGAIIARLAAEDPRVVLHTGTGPPPGWRGKAHACHRLAATTRLAAGSNDVLLYVDADVRVAPDVVERLLATMERDGVSVVTAVPRQITGTPGEALIVSLLQLTYQSWLPLALIPHVRARSVLAANGQLLAVRRSAYDACGGYAAVRDAIVDDMALCRLLKASGARVRFVDGDTLATCRMYQSGREALDGFSKNLYPGIGGTPVALLLVVSLYLACFVAPWFALPWFAWTGTAGTGWAAAGIGANLMQRFVLAVRHRQGPLPVLLHPVSAALFLVIAVRSAVWTWTGRGAWRGRLLTTPRVGGGLVGAYARWLVRGRLDGLYVRGLEETRARLAAGPLLLAANHVSWWDGVVMVVVNAALGGESRVLVSEAGMRRLPYLRWVGAIALPAGPAAWSAVRSAADWLDRPGRVLWIFPQGRQRPASLRPLGFAGGLALLARRAGLPVVPVALDYPFRASPHPSAVVAFGEPVAAGAAESACAALLDDLRDWADRADLPAELSGGVLPAQLDEAYVALSPGRTAPPQEGLGARILAGATRRAYAPGLVSS